MSLRLRLGVIACLLALVPSAPVSAARSRPTREPVDDEQRRALVGTWYQRQIEGEDVFYNELTLFADGTYCGFTVITVSDAPFSQSIGTWTGDDGWLNLRATRSTNRNELHVSDGTVTTLGNIVSVSRRQLRLGSLSNHLPGDSVYTRREPMRDSEVCRVAEGHESLIPPIPDQGTRP